MASHLAMEPISGPDEQRSATEGSTEQPVGTARHRLMCVYVNVCMDVDLCLCACV
jgi:hypothetical protein